MANHFKQIKNRFHLKFNQTNFQLDQRLKVLRVIFKQAFLKMIQNLVQKSTIYDDETVTHDTPND